MGDFQHDLDTSDWENVIELYKQVLANGQGRRLQQFAHPYDHQNLLWKFKMCWEHPIIRSWESSIFRNLHEIGDFQHDLYTRD